MSNSLTEQLSELNNKLLSTTFLFKEGSKLRIFLVEKGGIDDKKYYTLAEIMLGLKSIIRQETLFDLNNPKIILCSPQLEESLDRKAIHVSQFRNEVLKHLIVAYNQPLLKNMLIGQKWMNRQEDWHPIWNTLKLERLERSHSRLVEMTREINILSSMTRDRIFKPKPEFLNVLHLAPGADQNQITFTLPEITELLTKYILSRKEDIFDRRSILIAMVQNDPLGTAFGVKAFHRDQVMTLLLKQVDF